MASKGVAVVLVSAKCGSQVEADEDCARHSAGIGAAHADERTLMSWVEPGEIAEDEIDTPSEGDEGNVPGGEDEPPQPERDD